MIQVIYDSEAINTSVTWNVSASTEEAETNALIVLPKNCGDIEITTSNQNLVKRFRQIGKGTIVEA